MTKDELVRDALEGSNEGLWQRIVEALGGYPEGGVDFGTAKTVVGEMPDQELKLYLPMGEMLD